MNSAPAGTKKNLGRAKRALGTEGFTLIEIMISMAILVMISFSIFQATTETYRLRDILSKEGNFYNGIRLASLIVQRDISMIYTPTLMKPNPRSTGTPNTDAGGNSRGATELGEDLSQTFKFWTGAVEPTGLRPSRFVGTESKLSFISLSHIRVYKDMPESDFAKITYELENDTSATDVQGKVLVKTENANAFSLDDPLIQSRNALKTQKFELLHGIQKMSFQYYQKDGNTWKIQKSWDSDKEETKNRYPDMIEMKLAVNGPDRLNFEGVYKFRPEIPINGTLSPSN